MANQVIHPEDCEFVRDPIRVRVNRQQWDLLNCRWFDANILLNQLLPADHDGGAIRFVLDEEVVNG